jgi:tetratricopeptide (TPR) repeat protein
MSSGKVAEALPFAERAVAGQRVCPAAHGMLATILLQLGRPADAEAVVGQALECWQGSADAYDALAHVSMLLGQHERSNSLYGRVVHMAPNDPPFWYNFASSERSFGGLVEAEAACDKATALDATQHPNYLLHSELRMQSKSANHIEELQSQLSRRDLNDRSRIPLGYALAKELDDLQNFDAAFRWFAESAKLRQRPIAHDIAIDEKTLQRIGDVFPKDLSRRSPGYVDSKPFVFVVGLPRSGATLLNTF